MNLEIAKLFAAGITVAIGAIGPAIAVGMIGAKGLESIGRNPETIGDIRTTMLLGFAFAESIAIFSLLMALIIKFVN